MAEPGVICRCNCPWRLLTKQADTRSPDLRSHRVSSPRHTLALTVFEPFSAVSEHILFHHTRNLSKNDALDDVGETSRDPWPDAPGEAIELENEKRAARNAARTSRRDLGDEAVLEDEYLLDLEGNELSAGIELPENTPGTPAATLTSTA
ncbi:uncharacterized protein LAESUDRAFT_754773 [Laetiporus sulphureus 93-53]|uniref:Uncharacterized protein n=1 Tax=Laetiporus sulphureus 93-53 TaxID=1314785 RepID=A0A165HX07_9APHY|nr:uncharacterized protein LAESUDRAFT_754773 [Laetiporus sulphureus 93-53]KZT12300.1 hypothetical protein LAESUDRAFT_754773 [Laetiporus sulphureus 93-53]